MIVTLICVSVCAWVAHLYFEIEKKKVKLPGPKGVPIFGNLFQIDPKIHEYAYKLNEKYGELMCSSLFKMHEVLIGNAALAKEMFSREDTTGKPILDVIMLFEGEHRGVVNSQGPLWEEHRRFTLRQLRDFGFGKNSMETLILDEVSEFTDRLKKSKGDPVGGIKEKLSLAVLNSLWTIISGKRFHQEDPKLITLAKHLSDVTSAPAESGGIIFFMPWLRYIIPEYSGYRKMRKAMEMLREFVSEAVKQHQQTFQLDSPRDFIDVYLNAIENAKEDPSSTFNGEDGVKQLMAVVADLFFAGVDTTSTTLAWAYLYLIKHPHVQLKIQSEITSITGDTRQVSVADRPNMPYLQAAIEEILRITAIVPTAASHVILRDTVINGVHYPKGTILTVNAYYIQRCPKNWGDPDNFRPERFLSEDGKVFKKSENVITFSIGRRQCLGETLARDTIFLFIANILQEFNLKLDASKPEPSLEPTLSFLLNPEEYSLVFEGRS